MGALSCHYPVSRLSFLCPPSSLVGAKQKLIVAVVASNDGLLERLPLNHECGDKIRELRPSVKVLHDDTHAAATGTTGGDEAVQDSGEKPHPPSEEDQDEEPCYAIANSHGFPHTVTDTALNWRAVL